MALPFCFPLRGKPLVRGLILLAIAGFAGAKGIQIGAKVPEFHVVSGDDRELARDDLEGMISVIFYLSRSAQGVNRPLSSALTEFYWSQDEAAHAKALRVAVMNASEAKWPITQIWKEKLVEASEEREITVFGDWDGAMLRDFGFIDQESNVLIVDNNLRARYFAHGRIEGEEIERIKALLTQIIHEL